MRPARHCMVVHAYYPLGETRVQRQALALIDRDIEVDVLCLRGAGEPARETIDGVAVHRLPVGRHRRRGMVWQLGEYLVFFVLAMTTITAKHIARRYRTVQVHNLPDFLVFCAAVPKLTGARLILDIHDLMPELFASKTGRPLDDRLVGLIRLQERVSCRFADHVVTVTSEWKRTLGDRAVAPDRVSVVMNLADPRIFVPVLRDRAEGDSDALHVLYHGTFTHRYGVDLLIRAVHAVVDDIPGISLVLLGDGESRDELVTLAADLGLDGRVRFSDGMLDASDLPEALVAADIGVVPNRSDVFTDGLLPTKLLEYVAVGTPVLAARTPGVSAYFDDSRVAYFEPDREGSLADCLRALALDRTRLNDLTSSAAEFNSRHHWDAAAAAYADLITGLGG